MMDLLCCKWDSKGRGMCRKKRRHKGRCRWTNINDDFKTICKKVQSHFSIVNHTVGFSLKIELITYLRLNYAHLSDTDNSKIANTVFETLMKQRNATTDDDKVESPKSLPSYLDLDVCSASPCHIHNNSWKYFLGKVPFEIECDMCNCGVHPCCDINLRRMSLSSLDELESFVCASCAKDNLIEE